VKRAAEIAIGAVMLAIAVIGFWSVCTGGWVG
jgi:hypothetical protein